MSSVRDVLAAEVRTWKNELEFSRSMETAWQLITVGLERKSWKNLGQLAVVKFVPRFVSNGSGITHAEAVAVALSSMVVDADADELAVVRDRRVSCGAEAVVSSSSSIQDL